MCAFSPSVGGTSWMRPGSMSTLIIKLSTPQHQTDHTSEQEDRIQTATPPPNLFVKQEAQLKVS